MHKGAHACWYGCVPRGQLHVSAVRMCVNRYRCHCTSACPGLCAYVGKCLHAQAEGARLVNSWHAQSPVCVCVCACMDACGAWSLLAPLQPLTLAQPGSSLEDSRTGSHQACWHSCSYRGHAVRRTHPHPGSPRGPDQSQSQRGRRSGSHQECCDRRRSRRWGATGHTRSHLWEEKRRRGRMQKWGSAAFTPPEPSTWNALCSEPKSNAKLSSKLAVSPETRSAP